LAGHGRAAELQRAHPSRLANDSVALRRLHVPDKRDKHDALIAATALVHDLRVVTRNVQGFGPMGVEVFNPWQAM
jgi:hypothetical protein